VKVNWKAMTPQEVWDALKSAPPVAGPWTKHTHSYGCDCGSYPPGHQYHGDWSYRESVLGKEVATSHSTMSRESVDAGLRSSGWVLVD
jgi:hypothetical protein